MTPMEAKSGTYSIFWSEEDQEWVAAHPRYPSLSFLADSPVAALEGYLEVAID